MVIGYGFRDKAINGHLIRWMNASPNHRLVVADPDPDRLWRTARPAVQRESQSWSDRLTVIPKPVAELLYAELVEAMR